MHPDVAALLAVQEDDLSIHSLEGRLAELQPRIEQMTREHDRAVAALEQAQQAAAAEEKRRTDVAARVAQHKQLHDKNQTALNAITSMREATAATAQLEQAKRMIDEDERELAAIGQRLNDANRLVAERERTVAELASAQQEARSSLDEDKRTIESELASARGVREGKAQAVPRNLMTTYERIRSRKRVHAVFPLNGSSCGNCDTMIPMQRRSGLTNTGRMEICEGCGVMLYATD